LPEIAAKTGQGTIGGRGAREKRPKRIRFVTTTPRRGRISRRRGPHAAGGLGRGFPCGNGRQGTPAGTKAGDPRGSWTVPQGRSLRPPGRRAQQWGRPKRGLMLDRFHDGKPPLQATKPRWRMGRNWPKNPLFCRKKRRFCPISRENPVSANSWRLLESCMLTLLVLNAGTNSPTNRQRFQHLQHPPSFGP
jgi:hypothetical protein